MKSLLLSWGLILGTCDAQLDFVSLGNWGAGGGEQKNVAATLKSHQRKHPFSFIVSPGDNFADGIADLEDSRWQTHFEDVYGGEELNLPFFAALGHADWDGNVTAMAMYSNQTYGRPLYTGVHTLDREESRLPTGYEVDASRGLEKYRLGPRFTLPAFWYHYIQSFPDVGSSSALSAPPEISVFFMFIDTKILGANFPVDPFTSQHWGDLTDALNAAKKAFDWIIVVGDEAISSSGTYTHSRPTKCLATIHHEDKVHIRKLTQYTIHTPFNRISYDHTTKRPF